MKRAIVLFAHGARDPRWAEPFRRLQEIVSAREPELAVSLAFLELMSPRLPETVAELAASAVEEVVVVPVFLGQGGHVLRDLPGIIDELTTRYPRIVFRVTGAVGEDAQVLNAMATYCLDVAR
jgi:sirohydrochlorin cobaltochelatase